MRRPSCRAGWRPGPRTAQRRGGRPWRSRCTTGCAASSSARPATRADASRRRLAQLVLDGSKRATAGLRAEYDVEGEPLEQVDEEQCLLGDDGLPVARLRYTRVEVVRFDAVTWDFAQAEGEGFVDIEDWRLQHRGFWSRWYGVPEDDPAFPARDDALVVCLRFEVVEIL